MGAEKVATKQNLGHTQSPIGSFHEDFEKIPRLQKFFTWLSYLVIFTMGKLIDFLHDRGIDLGSYKSRPKDIEIPGFAKLYGFEHFYSRYVYRRVFPAFARPVASTPGATMDIVDRETDDQWWNFRMSSSKTKCMNMGSYNYLGFAQSEGVCADHVNEHLAIHGCGVASSRHELGNTRLNHDLESIMADFLGLEDCMVYGMGFATNSMNIPALIGNGGLILSDSLNHSSLVLGARLSGAKIQVFKHGDVKDLENKLISATTEGAGAGKRYSKILIIVEGIYSMEGSIVKLPEIIALKKKYKAYLYMDEAHSIGALGPHGRGIVDYWGCDPKDVDIMMGTFTKSFGGAGGYIAGTKSLINHLRLHSHSGCYAVSMPAPVALQVTSALNMIAHSQEGQEKIDQLAWNCRYFRRRLAELGFIVYGNKDSPVVPVLYYAPAKIRLFSTLCYERGLAVVTVGAPATPLYEARVRFCLSAAHDKHFIDQALAIISEVGDILKMKVSSKRNPKFSEQDEDFLSRYPTLKENTSIANGTVDVKLESLTHRSTLSNSVTMKT